MMYYSVEHRYYERVNGKLKLIGTVEEGEEADAYFLKGISGTIISAKDFKQPVYQGRTYKYLGSYDDAALYDDYKWQNYKLDSFELGDEDYFGLVLRYVYDKDGSAAAGGAAGASGEGDEQSAPPTGDEAPLGIYVLVLAAACCATAVTATMRRKKLR